MDSTSSRKITVTKLDYDEGYSNDTLFEAINQEIACYHVCRISLLYLSKLGLQPRLNKEHEYQTYQCLLLKIFGAEAADVKSYSSNSLENDGAFFHDAVSKNVMKGKDYGWLGRQSYAQDSPINFFHSLQYLYPKTYSKVLFSRQSLGAFRLCELLDPFIEKSLVHSIFSNSSYFSAESLSKRPFYVSFAVFPSEIKDKIWKLYQTNEMDLLEQLPTFINKILREHANNIKVNKKSKSLYLPLSSHEAFLVCFFNWFCVFDVSKVGVGLSEFKFELEYFLSRNTESQSGLLFWRNIFDNAFSLSTRTNFNIFKVMSKSVPLQIFYRLLLFFIMTPNRHKSLFLDLFKLKILNFKAESSSVDLRLDEDNNTLLRLQCVAIFILFCRKYDKKCLAEVQPTLNKYLGHLLTNIPRGDYSGPNLSSGRLHHAISLFLLYTDYNNTHVFLNSDILKENVNKTFTLKNIQGKMKPNKISLIKPNSQQNINKNTKPSLLVQLFFVVENINLYRYALPILFKRFTESSMAEKEVNLLSYFFSGGKDGPTGVYSINVLIIIFVCEIILKKQKNLQKVVVPLNLEEEIAAKICHITLFREELRQNREVKNILDLLKKNQHKICTLLYGVQDNGTENILQETKSCCYKILEQLYVCHNQTLIRLPTIAQWLFFREKMQFQKRIRNNISLLHKVYDIPVNSNVLYILQPGFDDNYFSKYFKRSSSKVNETENDIAQQIERELLAQANHTDLLPGYFSSYEVPFISSGVHSILKYILENLDLTDNDHLKKRIFVMVKKVCDCRYLFFYQLCALFVNLIFLKIGLYMTHVSVLVCLFSALIFKELIFVKTLAIAFAFCHSILLIQFFLQNLVLSLIN